MNVSAVNNISFGKKSPEGKVVWIQINRPSYSKPPKSTNPEANIDTYRSDSNSSKKGIKDKALDAIDTFCDTVSDILGE